MDMIAAAYVCESDEEDSSNPWASSRVSAKRTIGRDEEFPSRPFKKTNNRLPAPKLHNQDIFFNSINLYVYFYYRLIEYPETQEVVDDPSQHGNRIRNFPHERGNWASFIYLPCQ
jgi:hypothetical protein